MKQVLLLMVGCLLLSFSAIDSDKIVRWEIIGHKRVNPKIDHTEIPIKIVNNKSSALRFSINSGIMDIHHSKVYFEDGEVQTIPLRKKYTEGNVSKIVDLRGGIRKIIKCEIYYTPDRLAKKQPIIELWAKTEIDKELVDNN